MSHTREYNFNIMNKKVLMPIVVMILFFGLTFVYATELKWGFTTVDTQVEEKSINLIQGWNLIQGFADTSFIVGGTQGTANSQSYIKAIFVFNPINKEYVRIYPNPERSSVEALGPSILQLPFWVYSSKGGESMSYQTQKLETFGMTWPTGWNFISISNEMVGKSIFDVKGNCNIEKAYLWMSTQEWSFNLIEDTTAPDLFSSSDVGKGLIIKVSSECKLGLTQTQITPPPAIP